MKSYHNFLISVICLVLILYYYHFSYEILGHPYMFLLIAFLIIIGVWNIVNGIKKFIKEEKMGDFK